MTTSDLKTREKSDGASLSEHAFTSYSLNFEDVILHRLFPVSPTGFYVDVGAGHPRFENDLFSFYQRGWHGINVEPNHGFHAELMQERPRDTNLRVLLSDTAGGSLIFYEIDGSGLSTCDSEQARVYETSGRHVRPHQVSVTTLSNILTESGIDYINILKVDVEGFEEKVLNGNDWDRFRPDVVVVEATYPESPLRRPTNILSFMEQRGYRHAHFDGLNDFYLEKTFPAPEGLTLPPNVFDRFVPHQIVDLRDDVKSLRASFSTAEKYALSLKAESMHLTSETTRLTSENRRLQEAAEQMRAELLVLNQFMEQLHAVSEQLELRKRELSLAKARLASAYSSLSWRLTAPLRWCDDFQRRIVSLLRK
jgi:FkbM family methyltransferase